MNRRKKKNFQNCSLALFTEVFFWKNIGSRPRRKWKAGGTIVPTSWVEQSDQRKLLLCSNLWWINWRPLATVGGLRAPKIKLFALPFFVPSDDESISFVVSKIAPHPIDADEEFVFEATNWHEVNTRPKQPCEVSSEFEFSDISYCFSLPYCCQWTFILVREFLEGLAF